MFLLLMAPSIFLRKLRAGGNELKSTLIEEIAADGPREKLCF